MNTLPPGGDGIDRRLVLRGIGGGALLGLVGVPLLAACSSSDSPTPTPGTTGATPSGTLNILGTATYKVDANNPAGVNVNYGFASGNEDIISKTAQAGTFDMVSAFHGAIDQLDALNRVQPIDTARLANWSAIAASFRESESIRRRGDVVAVPHHWGYTYNVYDQSKIESPETVEALMSPDLKQRVIMPDDPYAVIGTFASFTGAENLNLLTEDEFKAATDLLMEFRPWVLTVHPYGEEGQIFGRGEALVGVAESANTVLLAREAGMDAAFNMFGSWSWFECYIVLDGAKNVDAALAYIDQALTEDAMVASVAKSQAFPVIDSAKAMEAIDEAFRYESADDVLAKAPLQPGVPLQSGDGIVGWPEWTAAWQAFKS